MGDIFEVMPRSEIEDMFSSLATPENISNINAQLADITTLIENFSRQTGEMDDSPRIQRAINSLTSGGEILFPPKTYTINSVFQINGMSNIKLRGLKGATLLVDSSINFLNFINANNCSLEGFIIQEKTYTTNQWFTEVSLPSSLLVANTNTNIGVSVSGNQFTISKNASTPQGTTQYYTISITLPDTTKEYFVQTYDGIMVGENGGAIQIVQHLSGGNKTYSLDQELVDSSSPGNYIWRTNYLPSGTTQIDLQFPYTYAYNSDNNSITYDLTKIKLFEANNALTSYSDNFNISLQGSNGITIKDNQFIGMKLYPIKPTNACNDITFKGNAFTNCVVGHISFSYGNRFRIEDNTFIIKILSDTGQEVAWQKAATRAVHCANAASHISIKNNHAYGTYFGGEIWYTTGLLIDNFKTDKVRWAFSICNNSTGRLINSEFIMLDNWNDGIEIAAGSKIDVDNVTFKGRSYQGKLFSLTQNTGGEINLTNIVADSCSILAQFTDNSIHLKNVEIKELISTGILALIGGSYTSSTVLLDDVRITNSTTLKITNTAYANMFIKTNDSTQYLKKLIMRDVKFSGKPNSSGLNIRVNEILADNLYTDSSPVWVSHIYCKDANDNMTIFRGCRLYSISFSEYPNTATNSLLVLQNNLYSATSFPTGTYVINTNNVAIV